MTAMRVRSSGRLRGAWSLWVGTALITALVIFALVGPSLARFEPNSVPIGGARMHPDSVHWFGTDQLGRDVFARIAAGARSSLYVGVGSALLAGVIGVLVGVWAGWRRGWVDALLMRITEVFLVIPALLIASAVIVVLDRTATSIVLVLGLTAWPVVARVVRAETQRVSSEGFVEAAQVAGASGSRIVVTHVVPHVLPIAVTMGVSLVGVSILAESSLSFLGIGLVDPASSWGLMITSAKRFLSPSPYLVLVPSAAIFLTVLAFVLLANGMRSALGLQRR